MDERVAVAVRKVEEWEAAALRDATARKRAGADARAALEVDIECHPLEPQLSQQVNNMMRAEEAAGRAGKHDKKRKLSAKIDAAIKQECRNALLYIIDLHKKRRVQLNKSQGPERAAWVKGALAAAERLQRDLGLSVGRLPLAELAGGRPGRKSAGRWDGGGGSSALPSVTPSPGARMSPSFGSEAEAALGNGGRSDKDDSFARGRSASVTAAAASAVARVADGDDGFDFAPAEEKMRRNVDEYWAEAERFNLREAFRSQAERIEVEWSRYLADMERDYRVAKAKVTGTPVDANGSPAPTSAPTPGSGKWVSKEKQDTLIHTAPVLRPEAGGFSTAATGSAKKHSSKRLGAAQRRELQELEARYEEAKRSVAIQREEALRWARRQSDRMLMQVDATEVERQQRRAIEDRENEAWNRVMELIRSSAKILKQAAENATGTPHAMASGGGDRAARKSRVGSGGSGRSKRGYLDRDPSPINGTDGDETASRGSSGRRRGGGHSGPLLAFTPGGSGRTAGGKSLDHLSTASGSSRGSGSSRMRTAQGRRRHGGAHRAGRGAPGGTSSGRRGGNPTSLTPDRMPRRADRDWGGSAKRPNTSAVAGGAGGLGQRGGGGRSSGSSSSPYLETRAIGGKDRAAAGSSSGGGGGGRGGRNALGGSYARGLNVLDEPRSRQRTGGKSSHSRSDGRLNTSSGNRRRYGVTARGW